MAQTGGLVVGFDLDMTLIRTTDGFRATLEALSGRIGRPLPVDRLSERLGPPLDLLLRDHLPAEEIPAAVDLFRALYRDTAIEITPVLPGAHDALAAVRREHGRILLVTGKYAPNAQLHVDHLGLDVDVVHGKVWGEGKAAALVEAGATVYVGDHVHDVEGARAAGITSVSVLTGGCTEAELREAGTDVVLPDLTAFPAWLGEHLLTVRLAALEERLHDLGSVLVAFSGGADSAFLLAAAVRALGADRVVAATGHSASLPQRERGPAEEFARALGVRLETPRTHEIEREGYRANAGDRCAFCKTELVEVLGPVADRLGLAAVATGTNADDARAGFRPGIAAAARGGAVTPLLDVGLTKDQVRRASRAWGLPTWDKPAAACLSSRVAFGIAITPARLARVERAEDAARAHLAARGIVVRDLRVRDLGDTARIELDRGLLPDVTADDDLLAAVAATGFAAAEIDPLGFRSGAMNELLADPERYR